MRTLQDTSPADAAVLAAAEEQLGEQPLPRSEWDPEESVGMRVVVFDEEGPHDMGRLMPEELHQVVGEAVGEEGDTGWTHVETESDEQILREVEDATAQFVGEPQTPPPVDAEAQALSEVKAWMATQPDPVPRMSDERLMQRIRIAEKWRGHCPKQSGSIAASNWGCYVDGMTVAAYLACPQVLGGRKRARKDLAWDLDHGFIELQNPNEWALEQQAEVAR